jgi:AcrR family transcriptional regulator
MPKVSEAHLEARRQQILAAAMRCFAERGFHATSMRDICSESSLSAGAVYRYFASKEDLIAGMVASEVEPMLAELESLSGEARLRAMIHGLFQRPDLEREMRVEISLWAEALTNPRIAELLRSNLIPLTRVLAETIALLQGEGRVADRTPARILAQRTQGALLGGMLQATVLPEFELDAYLEAVEASLLGPRTDDQGASCHE